MRLISSLAATSIALLAVGVPAISLTTTQGCPPGSVQELVTFTDTFGPEIGDWTNEILSVPKYVPEPDTTLIQVAVEICGQITGDVQFQNLDDQPCTLTYQAQAAAMVTPQDPASPVDDFDLSVGASGGPFLLDPGESGSDSFDSGLTCDPIQRFTNMGDVAFFIASPGDEDAVFDHEGITSSQHFGCGVIFFSSSIVSTLELRVTYVVCRAKENLPPTCSIAPVPEVECTGDLTVIQLDASGSTDPEGGMLQFLWGTDCPNASFDDNTSPTPLLMIDTSGGCNISCSVQVRVSDSRHTVGCGTDITIVPGAPGSPGLDIKPGSCPNPLNVGSNGLLPVGLLGTASFDVSDVDQATIRLQRADGVGGTVAPTQIEFGDVGTPFTGDGCDCHTLTADGILDLNLKFSKQEVVDILELDTEPHGSFIELVITGELLDDTPFESDGDCIRIINH